MAAIACSMVTLSALFGFAVTGGGVAVLMDAVQCI